MPKQSITNYFGINFFSPFLNAGYSAELTSPTAATTTAATESAATAATAAVATRSVGLGPGFVYGQIAAAQIGAVEGFHRLAGRIIVGHFDKGKSPWLAGVAIRDNADALHGAVLFKKRAYRVFGSTEAEVSYKYVFHFSLF